MKGQCLFDPSLPHCAADPEGGRPKGFFSELQINAFPCTADALMGYHSHENDEKGEVYPRFYTT